MLILMRKSFVDRALSAEDLVALGEIWSGWYAGYRGRRLVKSLATQQLEVRLWGFARADAERMLVTLRQRLTAVGLSGDCAQLRNPDTLSAAFPSAPLGSHWPQAAIDGLLIEEALDGLDVEARLSVREGGDDASVPAWTLVARGLISRGALLLKALYQAGARPGDERLFQRTAWRAEASCLRALDDYAYTAHPERPERTAFFLPGGERFELFISRLFTDLPGDDRIAGFLWRVGAWGVIGAVVLLVWRWLTSRSEQFDAADLMIGVTFLGVGLWLKVIQVVVTYRAMKSALRRVYSRPPEFPRTELPDEVLANPVNAKCSRELQEAGAVHLFDSRSSAGQTTYIRFYLLPSEHTYLMFNVMLATGSFRYFPAKPLFVAHTFFADNHRLVANNTQPTARPRTDPNVTALRFADVNDPLDFVDRYRAALRDVLTAGRQLAPILSAEELIGKIVEMHRDTGAKMRRRGYYTLRDAVAYTFTTGDRDEL